MICLFVCFFRKIALFSCYRKENEHRFPSPFPSSVHSPLGNCRKALLPACGLKLPLLQVRDLEGELESEVRRSAEAQREARRLERGVKELTYQVLQEAIL